LIDPSTFIAPFAILYALYIIFIYLAIYTRKKILEEGKNWRGLPIFFGVVAFFVIIGAFYFGIYVFYFLSIAAFFIIPLLVALPLIYAYKANSKIKRRDRIEYETIHREMTWSETLGIVGPILVLIGCVMLFISAFLRVIIGWYYMNYLSTIFTWVCSLIGFSGVILGIKGRTYGRFLCLLAGVLLVAGIYIPFGLYLTIPLMMFDPYIVGIGGILSILSRDDFLIYYLKKSEFTEKFISLEVKIDKIEDLKMFLQEKLGSDWEKIKISLEAYQAGELDKSTFIATAIKNIGNNFIDIFKEVKRGEINKY
jgi:hypothetical protein